MTGQIETTVLEKSTYQLLKRAAQYAATLYQQSLGRSGLTQRQFTVLVAVGDNDGINQTQLVQMTGIDRSTTADLVARLLQQGYLERQRDKNDGRMNTLSITKAGQRAIDQAMPAMSTVDQQLLEVVPKSHRNGFLAGLNALAVRFDPATRSGQAD